MCIRDSHSSVAAIDFRSGNVGAATAGGRDEAKDDGQGRKTDTGGLLHDRDGIGKVRAELNTTGRPYRTLMLPGQAHFRCSTASAHGKIMHGLDPN